MINRNLSLYKLTSEIEGPVQLTEVLELYNAALLAEDQYASSTLIDVLKLRMDRIVGVSLYMTPHRSQALSSLETLLNQVVATQSKLGHILSIVNAADYGSLIYDSTSQCEKALNELSWTVHKLFLDFNTQVFDEAKTDFKSLQTVMKKLKDLVAKKLYEMDWLKVQLAEVKQELKSFSRITHDKKWRIDLSKNFEGFRVEFAKVDHLVTLIERNKDLNPLISDELLRVSLKLRTDYRNMLKFYEASIQLVYVYEDWSEKLNDAIAIYLLLSSKIGEV